MKIQNTSTNNYQNRQNFGAVTISGKPVSRAAVQELIQDKKGASLRQVFSAIAKLVRQDVSCGNSNTTIDIMPAALDSIKLTKIIPGKEPKSEYASLNSIRAVRNRLNQVYSILVNGEKRTARGSIVERRTHSAV